MHIEIAVFKKCRFLLFISTVELKQKPRRQFMYLFNNLVRTYVPEKDCHLVTREKLAGKLEPILGAHARGLAVSIVVPWVGATTCV